MSAKEVPKLVGGESDEESKATMKKSDLASQILEESKKTEEETKNIHNKVIGNVNGEKSPERPRNSDDTQEDSKKMKHSLFTTPR